MSKLQKKVNPQGRAFHPVCVGGVCVHIQLYLTLCDSIHCSPPGSSVHGVSPTRILEWVTISSSISPWIESGSPALQADSLLTKLPEKSLFHPVQATKKKSSGFSFIKQGKISLYRTRFSGPLMIEAPLTVEPPSNGAVVLFGD